MGLFVGTFLDEPERKTIQTFQSSVFEESLDAAYSIAWTNPQKLHLTWSFLGEVVPEEIQKLRQNLSNSLADLQALYQEQKPQICFDNLTWWPTSVNPHVLVLTPSETTETISFILEVLKVATSGLISCTIQKNDFAAHVTLGRVRRSKKLQTILSEHVPEAKPNFQKGSQHDFEIFFASGAKNQTTRFDSKHGRISRRSIGLFLAIDPSACNGSLKQNAAAITGELNRCHGKRSTCIPTVNKYPGNS